MERQLVTDPNQADPSHLERYKFAAKLVDGSVLDAACGCGYGSHVMYGMYSKVQGVDIEPTAIDHARKHFNGDFHCMNVMDVSGSYNYIVSFETIEHVQDDKSLIKLFRKIGKHLICSVPNQDLYPFDPEIFRNDEYPHLRHYTPQEFETLLTDAGWEVTGRYCQKDKRNPVIREGVDGRFMVFTAK